VSCSVTYGEPYKTFSVKKSFINWRVIKQNFKDISG